MVEDITPKKSIFKMDRKIIVTSEMNAPGKGKHFLFSFMVVALTTGRLSREKHTDCLSLKQAGRAWW